MKLKEFKCPQCGNEFDDCRTGFPGKITGVCRGCGLVCHIEDETRWRARLRYRMMQAQSRCKKHEKGTKISGACYNWIKSRQVGEPKPRTKKAFNPSKR